MPYLYGIILIMKQTIINSVEEMTPYLEKLKNIKVWVCNTACGKSYLSSLDDRFFDLDAFRSHLHHLGIEDFENQTIPKMWEEIDAGKIVLNAAHGYFLKYLDENNIPFVYMYEKADAEAEYIERMRHRGSSEDFIERFGTIIASQYPIRANEKRGTFKIEMNSNEFVSDYIWKVFGMPEKYIYSQEFKPEQYKMAFIDLDGTLLDRKSGISEFTEKIIKQLKSKVNIVLTSGRSHDTIFPILKKLGLNGKENIAICCNGAFIMRGDGKILQECRITKSSIEHFLNGIDSQFLSSCYLRTFDHKICIKGIQNLQEFITKNKVYKIMLIGLQDKDSAIVLKSNKEIDRCFNVFKSAEGLIEFVPKRVSKATAAQKIVNLFNIDQQNLIAIGDGGNDIDLFKMVECSIAVCNANEEVKSHAKYITDSNNDDGVAKALKKIFMI